MALGSRQPEGRDRRRNAAVVAAAVALTVAGGVLFGRHPLIFLPWAACLLYFLVRWHAGVTVWRCSGCGHDFAVSAWRDFISPQLLETKYLRCPACGRRGWAQARMRAD